MSKGEGVIVPLGSDESLLPSIHKIGSCNSQIIKDWLDGLPKVEVSDSYWFDRDGISTTPPSQVAQQLFESLSINTNDEPPQLFSNAEERTLFDTDYRAVFHHVEEVLSSKFTSNKHPLKCQFLACPPNFKFKLHSHPNVELCIPFVGELSEKRLLGACLNPDLLTGKNSLTACGEAPSEEEMRTEKNALQQTMNENVESLGEEGKFVDRTLKEGEVLFNEVGTVHQSYTSNCGCLLLAVWSGLHADLENCTCYESLFIPEESVE